ncbi:MAG: serine hydrolase domain-containing protein [Lachnospiraceae bacterium]
MITLQEKIQTILDVAVENKEAAGINALIIHQDEEIAYCQSGHADIAKQIPYRRDTIFRMYSMTKPVTGAAAMLLMARGQLDLGTSVSEFLPGFSDIKVHSNGGFEEPRRDVKVADLLSMTSGIPYPGTLEDQASQQVGEVFAKLQSELPGNSGMDTETFANRLGECGLSFHPGEHWMYGASADVLGAIIEQVSGMKFGEFLKKEFFDPLGMYDTGFFVPDNKQKRLAKVYQNINNMMQEEITSHLGILYDQRQAPKFESGGAGLFSTLDDFAKFAAMLLSGGIYAGKKYYHPATVQYFINAELQPWLLKDYYNRFDTLSGFSYGNLMRTMKSPAQSRMIVSKGEYGWDGWLGAYFANCPEDSLTILLSMQRVDAGTMPVTRKVRNLVLSTLGKTI